MTLAREWTEPNPCRILNCSAITVGYRANNFQPREVPLLARYCL